VFFVRRLFTRVLSSTLIHSRFIGAFGATLSPIFKAISWLLQIVLEVYEEALCPQHLPSKFTRRVRAPSSVENATVEETNSAILSADTNEMHHRYV
jgi:hypothetical protein